MRGSVAAGVARMRCDSMRLVCESVIFLPSNRLSAQRNRERPVARICPATPRSSKTSILRGCSPFPREPEEGPSAASTRRTSTPRRASSTAATSPTGPAPTTSTPPEPVAPAPAGPPLIALTPISQPFITNPVPAPASVRRPGHCICAYPHSLGLRELGINALRQSMGIWRQRCFRRFPSVGFGGWESVAEGDGDGLRPLIGLPSCSRRGDRGAVPLAGVRP
jgi:hypothetical protein